MPPARLDVARLVRYCLTLEEPETDEDRERRTHQIGPPDTPLGYSDAALAWPAYLIFEDCRTATVKRLLGDPGFLCLAHWFLARSWGAPRAWRVQEIVKVLAIRHDRSRRAIGRLLPEELVAVFEGTAELLPRRAIAPGRATPGCPGPGPAGVAPSEGNGPAIDQENRTRDEANLKALAELSDSSLQAVSRAKIVERAGTGNPTSRCNKASFKRLQSSGLVLSTRRAGTRLTSLGKSLTTNNKGH